MATDNIKIETYDDYIKFHNKFIKDAEEKLKDAGLIKTINYYKKVLDVINKGVKNIDNLFSNHEQSSDEEDLQREKEIKKILGLDKKMELQNIGDFTDTSTYPQDNGKLDGTLCSRPKYLKRYHAATRKLPLVVACAGLGYGLYYLSLLVLAGPLTASGFFEPTAAVLTTSLAVGGVTTLGSFIPSNKLVTKLLEKNYLKNLSKNKSIQKIRDRLNKLGQESTYTNRKGKQKETLRSRLKRLFLFYPYKLFLRCFSPTFYIYLSQEKAINISKTNETSATMALESSNAINSKEKYINSLFYPKEEYSFYKTVNGQVELSDNFNFLTNEEKKSLIYNITSISKGISAIKKAHDDLAEEIKSNSPSKPSESTDKKEETEKKGEETQVPSVPKR